MTPRPLTSQDLGAAMPALQRYARRLCRGGAADADDVVQETCVRVLGRPRLVTGDPTSYLLASLRNTFLSTIRTAAGRVDVPLGSGDLPRTRDHQEHRVVALDLEDALRRLDVDRRAVILAVDVLGLSYAEAASLLDVPVGTVMSRLSRARDDLASRLGGVRTHRVRTPGSA